ncbi:hypothetical protein OC25_12250 [Pedobacter kyungheensis]|uniref:Uncharacterized protein n=1 Tax=Pedobacter kyungheensis TaxID=1069985 RepID=A0A0C1D889_9SPHI|nr:hypothetical protein [Pedobacter kyungheensis]KIA93541.1 hypothetical protein OC25_12250 [Pedobacter kyungheensis]
MFRNLKIAVSFILVIVTFIHCTNKKTDSRKVNCLSDLMIFADTLNLDTSKTLEYHFKTRVSQAIFDCDLNTFRHNKQLNKATARIILKINYYFIQKGWGNDEDLLPLYSISPFLNKILDEGVYMQTKKERQGQEIQILTASSLATFILNDNTLSKDKDLILLIEKCYPRFIKKKYESRLER